MRSGGAHDLRPEWAMAKLDGPLWQSNPSYVPNPVSFPSPVMSSAGDESFALSFPLSCLSFIPSPRFLRSCPHHASPCARSCHAPWSSRTRYGLPSSHSWHSTRHTESGRFGAGTCAKETGLLQMLRFRGSGTLGFRGIGAPSRKNCPEIPPPPHPTPCS